MRRAPLLTLLLLLLPIPAACRGAHAQAHQSALSDAEVEKLRDTAYDAPQRLLSFMDFLDIRAKALDKLTTGRRHAGREEDIHDLFEQFTSISDDLNDNLDDWGKRHMDVRKVIPKLLAATERWQTALKSPPDNEAYNLSRKLALEGIADIRETADKLLDRPEGLLPRPPTRQARQSRQT